MMKFVAWAIVSKAVNGQFVTPLEVLDGSCIEVQLTGADETLGYAGNAGEEFESLDGCYHVTTLKKFSDNLYYRMYVKDFNLEVNGPRFLNTGDSSEYWVLYQENVELDIQLDSLMLGKSILDEGEIIGDLDKVESWIGAVIDENGEHVLDESGDIELFNIPIGAIVTTGCGCQSSDSVVSDSIDSTVSTDSDSIEIDSTDSDSIDSIDSTDSDSSDSSESDDPVSSGSRGIPSVIGIFLVIVSLVFVS